MLDGRLVCGATSHPNDSCAELRLADHLHNLQRLTSLAGIPAPPPEQALGRVGWRATAADRLPSVGPMPVPHATLPAHARLDQCRLVPRVPGLWVLGALASRGLTWGPLAAQVLASQITGAPLPVESDLLDAIDPARQIVREARREAKAAAP